MSFFTSAWLLPQKEQRVTLEPRAMVFGGWYNVARKRDARQGAASRERKTT